MRCGGRLAIVERNLRGGSSDLLSEIRLGRRNTRRKDCQAARSIERSQVALGRKPLPLQQSIYALAQFANRAIDHPGGNFFATNLKQEIWHWAINLCSQN